MAIFRPGSLSGGISGTIGGLVFVAGQRGTIVRPRPATLNKSSPRLQVARARSANGRAAWEALTDDQRTSWRAASSQFPTTNALGASSPPSGFQLYMRNWLGNFADSGEVLTDPPTSGTSSPPTNVAVDFSIAGAYEVDAEDPVTGGTGKFAVYGYPFFSSYDNGAVPRLIFLTEAAVGSFPLDVKALWISEFGDLQLGQHFAVGVNVTTNLRLRSQLVTLRDAAVA